MDEFLWVAIERDGRKTSGQISAPSADAAVRTLRQRGLTPLTLNALADADAAAHAEVKRTSGQPATATNAQSASVKPKDLMILTRELAVMLNAGLPLEGALRVLLDMAAQATVAQFLDRTLAAIKRGSSLSQALNEISGFDAFYINMVRAGEASGQLAAALTRLAEHLTRARALRDNLISAAIYPAILLLVAVASLVAMLAFVVPQFEPLFMDMGDALPLATYVVMQASQSLRSEWLWWLGALVLTTWALRRLSRSRAGGLWLQVRLLKVPALGAVMKDYQLALYVRSLATMLGSGVPMVRALDIALLTVSNPWVSAALGQVQPTVKSGKKVSEAVRNTQVFDPLAVSLVRVGEETGRLAPMLSELADLLDEGIATRIKRLLTLVEPALILVLGALIAAMIVSVMLGILAVNDLAA